ncbi:hypothetical protein CFB81_22035 [Burkholderia sp. AU28863]|nr:hypothetical protein CFB81_22035 [Burkholderia sp. AU28863]
MARDRADDAHACMTACASSPPSRLPSRGRRSPVAHVGFVRVHPVRIRAGKQPAAGRREPYRA